MTGYQALANAIVEQAVKDYRKALCRLKQRPGCTIAMVTVREVESFFHSAWYAQLTEIDPDYLIDRLRKEVA